MPDPSFLEPADVPVAVIAQPADVPVAPAADPVAANPAGNCLTKTYTDNGLVVFADTCTKEAASAPAGDPPAPKPVPPPPGRSSDATKRPTSGNYAGLTYQQFIAP